MIPKANNLPKQKGLYFFYNADNELVYIGKANDLRLRFYLYWRDWNALQRFKKYKGNMRAFDYATQRTLIVKNLDKIEKVDFVYPIDNIKDAEKKLIKFYTPKYNMNYSKPEAFGEALLEAEQELRNHFGITREEEMMHNYRSIIPMRRQ